jgi:hypothetical protein
MTHSHLDEVRLVSHSNVFYPWPAWVIGYLLAIVSYFEGDTVTLASGMVQYIHPGNSLGLMFVATIVLLIIFTNAQLRGIYSVMTLVTLGFVALLLAWLGWWDDIFDALPYLSARANVGFYLLFSTTLLTVWLLSFFVFDRLTYWSVTPGQMTEKHFVGGGEKSFDTHGMVFRRRNQDFFKHIILGLDAGDIVLATSGARSEEVHVPNVLFVDNKLQTVQHLTAVQPEHVPHEQAASR